MSCTRRQFLYVSEFPKPPDVPKFPSYNMPQPTSTLSPGSFLYQFLTKDTGLSDIAREIISNRDIIDSYLIYKDKFKDIEFVDAKIRDLGIDPVVLEKYLKPLGTSYANMKKYSTRSTIHALAPFERDILNRNNSIDYIIETLI